MRRPQLRKGVLKPLNTVDYYPSPPPPPPPVPPVPVNEVSNNSQDLVATDDAGMVLSPPLGVRKTSKIRRVASEPALASQTIMSGTEIASAMLNISLEAIPEGYEDAAIANENISAREASRRTAILTSKPKQEKTGGFQYTMPRVYDHFSSSAAPAAESGQQREMIQGRVFDHLDGDGDAADVENGSSPNNSHHNKSSFRSKKSKNNPSQVHSPHPPGAKCTLGGNAPCPMTLNIANVGSPLKPPGSPREGETSLSLPPIGKNASSPSVGVKRHTLTGVYGAGSSSPDSHNLNESSPAPEDQQHRQQQPTTSSTKSLDWKRLQLRIVGLCQKLFAVSDGNSQLEIIVKENGQALWCGNAEEYNRLRRNSSDGYNGSGDDFDPEVDDGDDDPEIAAVKERAKKAYSQTVDTFKVKMFSHQRQLKELKQELASKQPGGNKYEELQKNFELAQTEIARQAHKINTLVSMLERAGQSLRYYEEQRETDRQSGLMRQKGAANWHDVKAYFPDLNTEDRTDLQISQDLCSFMDQNELKMNELSEKVDQMTESVTEASAKAEALSRTNKVLRKENDQLRYEVETLRAQLSGEKSASSSKAGSGGGGGEPSKQYEGERSKLLDQITSLESALRQVTEVREMLPTLGFSMQVVPFLRCNQEAVRNLVFTKAATENIIAGVWLTRFLPTVSSSKNMQDVGIGHSHGKLPNFDDASALEKAAQRMFVSCVTAFVSQAYVPQTKTSNSTGVTLGPGAVQHFETMATAGSVSPSSSGLEIAEDRHVACDFTDAANLSLWTVKRSELKRVLNFADHLLRYVLEVVDPQLCASGLLQGYSASSGISTPPLPTLQWLRKLDLVFAPSQPTLLNPGCSLPTPAAEWIYSLMNACEKFCFDADVDLFRRIVRGDIPETAYFDQMIMMQKLKLSMQNSHTLLPPSVRPPGPTVRTVMLITERFFPTKTKDRLHQLMRSILIDLKNMASDGARSATSAISLMSSNSSGSFGSPTNTSVADDGKGGFNFNALPQAALAMPVDIPKLFASNDVGNEGFFVEAVRDQYVEELVEYANDIVKSIIMCGSGGGGGAGGVDDSPLNSPKGATGGKDAKTKPQRAAALNGTCPLRTIVRALSDLDPAKNLEEIQNYVFHLVQLYVEGRMQRQEASRSDLDVLNVSKEDLCLKFGDKYWINTEELASYCSKVLHRRSGWAAAAPAVLSPSASMTVMLPPAVGSPR